MFYDPSLKYTDENGKEHISSIGGYFNRHKPIECQSFEIELVKLTQEEIDADPERWRSYEAGDLTGCFNTEEEVLNLIKRYSKRDSKGIGKWNLEMPTDVLLINLKRIPSLNLVLYE